MPGRLLTLPIFFEHRDPPEATLGIRSDTHSSDEELIVELRAGDSNALHVLFDRYYRLVFSVALRILHDRGEAEDIAQDLFCYLYQKSALFDAAKGSVKAWIVQIAFHRTLDRKSYLARRGFFLGTEIDSLNDKLVGKTDLDNEVGALLNRPHLEKALQALSEKQRRTLEMFYFEGLELREISEILGEPLGNIRHHFYRGLEQLRKNVFVQKLGRRKQ